MALVMQVFVCMCMLRCGLFASEPGSKRMVKCKVMDLTPTANNFIFLKEMLKTCFTRPGQPFIGTSVGFLLVPF